MSILFYKRPEHVPPKNGPLAICRRPEDSAKDCSNAAIPPELSFENVICNKCGPPCSLQDLLDYMTYETHDAENLQLYLWMIDYFKRFRSAPKAERALAPRWKGDRPSRSNNKGPEVPAKDKGGALSVTDVDVYSDYTSNASTWEGDQSDYADEYTQTLGTLAFSASHVKQYSGDGGAGSSQPSPIQPFRAEIDRVITHYIAPGSPRQLNLSHNDRATVLRALEHTTHPSALALLKKILDSTLRNQSHPNFIRWSICNGNKQWTFALRAFAVLVIMIGFVIATVLILSHASRYWRILAAPVWWVGITNIIAASQGLCVLLHHLYTRQSHAWELKDYPLNDDEAGLKGEEAMYIKYEQTKSKWPVKMEVFGPANNYGGESWVNHYARKPWYKKLFEGRVKVQETGLRSIQNRMVWQAEAWALLIAVPLTVVFVAIPNANLF